MKQFQIEVVGVTPPVFTKTARGGYNTLEVAYKQDVKVTGKKLLDFVTKATYDVLVNAKAGEVYFIEAEKNEKGYIDWLTATPVDPTTTAVEDAVAQDDRRGAAAAPAKPSTMPTARGRVVGNTYETPEERFTNRAAIIRQSTLNMAVEVLGPNPSASTENILALARRFEDHVYTDLQARAESLRTVVDGLKG